MKTNKRFDQIKPSDVKSTLQLYPDEIQNKLLDIREMIFELASTHAAIGDIEETLKWGEPSSLAKHGSTVRLAWRKSAPEQYGIYFNCKSKLIETFKEIYPTTFAYSDNRAIILNPKLKIPSNELKHCLQMALTYHKIKHLNLLGA